MADRDPTRSGSMGSARSKRPPLEEIITTRRDKLLREPKLYEQLVAECVGTFFLVFTVGAAATSSNATLAAVAIGLVLAVMIYVFGAVSGGLLNPAVTFAVALSGRGKLSPLHALVFVAVQIAGGIFGALLAYAGTERSFCFDYEVLKRGWGTSFEFEMIFTAALCLVVLAAGTSNDAPNQYFGFAIGMTVAGSALASGGFNQGSLNPAVTVGINLANYANGDAVHNPSFGAWLVFLFGPLVGAALAAGIFRITRGNEFEEYEQEREIKKEITEVGAALASNGDHV